MPAGRPHRRGGAGGLTTSPGQWPEFTTDAREVGVQSVLALPLGANPVRLGALNIYGPKIDAFSDRH
ncbi:MAG: hypothetical protein ACXVXW_10160, partial [Mycobacteriaceae bacterium]